MTKAHHNRAGVPSAPAHLRLVSEGQDLQVVVQGAAVEHLEIPAEDRELRDRRPAAGPPAFSSLGGKVLHSKLKNWALILQLMVNHRRPFLFPSFLHFFFFFKSSRGTW